MMLIDLHCDTIEKLARPFGRGSLERNPYGVDLARLREADALVQCFSMYFYTGAIPAPLRERASFWMADRRLDVWERERDRCPKKPRLIETAEDLSRCQREKRVGALLTLEDAVPVGSSLEKLHHFYRRGIRLITFTWNFENAAGYPNSARADIMERGLKPFGFLLLEEMERLGMIADVSHLSDGGFWDVARHSRKPFIASHSNARAVTPHPRNLTDEMIRAVADAGGVIGLNFCPKFLGTGRESRILDMLRHIRHIYRVGGAEVLAIGTDFDGITGRLQIPGTEKLYRLSDALKKHGMPSGVLEKMWGRNALRVMKEVLRAE